MASEPFMVISMVISTAMRIADTCKDLISLSASLTVRITCHANLGDYTSMLVLVLRPISRGT